MKEHAKALWGHLPVAVQHVVKSAFAGAGIGMLTAVFAETMKQVGIQPPTPPGQAPNAGQSWAKGEQHRRHYHHGHNRRP